MEKQSGMFSKILPLIFARISPAFREHFCRFDDLFIKPGLFGTLFEILKLVEPDTDAKFFQPMVDG
jgi:hypothetical protein